MAVERADSPLERLRCALAERMGPDAVQSKQALARYTALRVGGAADLLVKAENAKMLRQAVTAAWEQSMPCRVLGGGSNVLVSDAGVRGLVVLNRARAITFPAPGEQPTAAQGAAVRAESGTSLSTLARQCVARGLAGLEWAVGIPGTVGGAVVGNAGAWGSDVASTLLQATVLERDGTVSAWPAERFQYSYRSSALKRPAAASSQQHGARMTMMHDAIVIDAEFSLQPADRETLESRIADITARRKASQPAGATCGSVFKNPPGDYAGRLIEAAGLKGTRRGGAEISTVHANFIVNIGDARAADVKALIDLARENIQARFGVRLELEIELVGEW